MTTKISVIIPFYNCEKTIEECLSSVINQTFRDFEVILIDDGSSDNSFDICQKYIKTDERIRIYQQKNKGPGQARNKGIELAKGDYLMFLDADDFWEPDLLSILYERAVLTQADITSCRFWTFNDEMGLDQEVDWDIKLPLIRNPYLFNPKEYSDKIFQLFNTAAWFSLYNKKFILKNDICFASWIRSEDNLFTMSAVAMADKVSIVNRRLVHYRVNTGERLENRVIDLWKNTFKASAQVRRYLESKGVFECFKDSFINRTLEGIKWYLLKLTPYPVKSFIENQIVEKVIPEFDLICRDNKLFENYEDKQFLIQLNRKKNYSDLLEKLFYEKRDSIIPIVYTVCEKTFLNAIISIESIKQHQNANYFYDIYVLHTDLTTEWQEKLESLSQSNLRITCVNIQSYLPDEIKTRNLIEKEKTYLCFLNQVIGGYDKVICLSPGTIVSGDLTELLKIPMEDDVLAACFPKSEDPKINEIFKAYQVTSKDVISDDVMVLNLLLWKKEEVSKRLLNLFLALKASRSEILSIGCLYRILPLAGKWNHPASDDSRVETEKNEIISYDVFKLNQNKNLFCLWWSLAQKNPCFEAILLTAVEKQLKGVQSLIISNFPSKKLCTQKQ